tara:strand:- start:3748 stop:4158 length:411 start_codon:yes stop_codon:yes gene_type:complete
MSNVNTEINKHNIPKLDVYLNKSETDNLNYLEKKANLSKQFDDEQSNFMNKSLNEILKDWSKVNIDILSDLVNMLSKLSKYSNYFNELDESENILRGVFLICKDIYELFTKEDRAIYFGITLVIVSILFYFIGISS